MYHFFQTKVHFLDNANARHELYCEQELSHKTKVNNVDALIMLKFVMKSSYLLFIFDTKEVGGVEYGWISKWNVLKYLNMLHHLRERVFHMCKC